MKAADLSISPVYKAASGIVSYMNVLLWYIVNLLLYNHHFLIYLRYTDSMTPVVTMTIIPSEV